MTSSRKDPTAAALVVIDVQHGVVDAAHDRDGVVERIAALVRAARDGGVPVVWVQHEDDELVPGSAEWTIVAPLEPAPDEPRVAKRFRSAFEGTELEAVLAGIGARHLVVCGAETDHCVRSTLHAALERGHDLTLVSDAHTTTDGAWTGTPLPPEHVIAELNRSMRGHELPGRSADARPAAEVAQDLRRGWGPSRA